MAGKDRERRLARERHERQEVRRQEARYRARRRNAWISAAIATALVVGGLGYLTAAAGENEPAQPAASAAPSPAASPTQPTPTTAAGDCEYRDAAGGKVKDVGRPPTKPDKSTRTQATLTTNRGAITIGLDSAAAPCTVNSMRYLASKNYFDESQCHRLTTEGLFVLQCGDPTATGQGGPGYEFDEENLPSPGGSTYPKGTVAMANAGPGTNGSQFFLVYKDTTLPPDYTIFGQVTAGLGLVEKVAAAGTETGSDGPPQSQVVIRDVKVTERKA